MSATSSSAESAAPHQTDSSHVTPIRSSSRSSYVSKQVLHTGGAVAALILEIVQDKKLNTAGIASNLQFHYQLTDTPSISVIQRALSWLMKQGYVQRMRDPRYRKRFLYSLDRKPPGARLSFYVDDLDTVNDVLRAVVRWGRANIPAYKDSTIEYVAAGYDIHRNTASRWLKSPSKLPTKRADRRQSECISTSIGVREHSSGINNATASPCDSVGGTRSLARAPKPVLNEEISSKENDEEPTKPSINETTREPLGPRGPMLNCRGCAGKFEPRVLNADEGFCRQCAMRIASKLTAQDLDVLVEIVRRRLKSHGWKLNPTDASKFRAEFLRFNCEHPDFTKKQMANGMRCWFRMYHRKIKGVAKNAKASYVLNAMRQINTGSLHPIQEGHRALLVEDEIKAAWQPARAPEPAAKGITCEEAVNQEFVTAEDTAAILSFKLNSVPSCEEVDSNILVQADIIRRAGPDAKIRISRRREESDIERTFTQKIIDERNRRFLEKHWIVVAEVQEASG